jgi:hypothetical protein
MPAIGKSATWSSLRRPSRPATARTGGGAAAASACARTSISTRSSSASSSVSALSARTRTSTGAVAPGICKPSSAMPKRGSPSPATVGKSKVSPIAPMRGVPGTGAPGSSTTFDSIEMRPPGEPSSSGWPTAPPPCLRVRNSGTCSVVCDTGAGARVSKPRPRPMRSASGCASSTVSEAVRPIASTWMIGSQVTPARMSRSAAPSASSTKAIRASRCAGLASMSTR